MPTQNHRVTSWTLSPSKRRPCLVCQTQSSLKVVRERDLRPKSQINHQAWLRLKRTGLLRVVKIRASMPSHKSKEMWYRVESSIRIRIRCLPRGLLSNRWPYMVSKRKPRMLATRVRIETLTKRQDMVICLQGSISLLSSWSLVMLIGMDRYPETSKPQLKPISTSTTNGTLRPLIAISSIWQVDSPRITNHKWIESSPKSSID